MGDKIQKYFVKSHSFWLNVTAAVIIAVMAVICWLVFSDVFVYNKGSSPVDRSLGQPTQLETPPSEQGRSSP
jgi:hypothetical protein